jgi:DNA-binding NarL/FixJ family response regulator
MDSNKNDNVVVLGAALDEEFVKKLESSNSRYTLVVSEAKSVLSLAAHIARHEPGILLLKRGWLCDQGLGHLRELRDLDYDFAIAVAARDLNAATIAKCVPLGLAGVIDPRDSAERIIKALDVISAGDVWISRHRLVEAMSLLTGGTTNKSSHVWNKLPSLTDREHDVLLKIMDGLSNRDIARTMGISRETVKVHVKHLFSKLGVHRRAQLLARRLSMPRVDSVTTEPLSH